MRGVDPIYKRPKRDGRPRLFAWSMASSSGSVSAPVMEAYDEEECAGLEPFFYDEAEAVADHERRVRSEQEEARLEDLRKQRMQQAYGRIRDCDPKQGGHYFTRLYFADFREFDIDEECKPIHLSIPL